MVMNERIKQLAVQATTYIEPTATSGEGWIFDKEKFAELIVRECAAEADKQTIYCRGIPWGRWIKEHFGVKE
jgi:hypothetical protein